MRGGSNCPRAPIKAAFIGPAAIFTLLIFAVSRGVGENSALFAAITISGAPDAFT
tara:strand:- start:9886 stop:10050 length:165 start_codon:yes stop_codon:yes gene_type:complete